MKILSPHCIQADPLLPEKVREMREEFWSMFRLAEMGANAKRVRWNRNPKSEGSPIEELRMGEHEYGIEQLRKMHARLPNHGAFEVTRSRFNAILSCGDVDTHKDKHVVGWTWLTYLCDENETGKFYMAPKEEDSIEKATLVLPVTCGTSFCFDNLQPHGFRIENTQSRWVPFLSLIVTRDSVMEILESEVYARRRKRA